MQGDTLSSLITSNQEDTIGKKLLDENPDFLYKYKGVVPIGVMAMVDDTVTITEVGHKTQQMNAFFNVKSAEKKLQFSEHKCHTMLIHKAKHINQVSELKVNIWKQTHDSKNNFIEEFDGEHILKETVQTKYLGCILSNDGTNTKSIRMKVNKSIGIRKTIQTLIKGLGKYTIESGIIYFKSLLRGSILYATESMINLKDSDVKLMEQAEEATLRDLVKTERSAPRHLLYLELGVIPARYVIKQRKIMHLKHILMPDEHTLMKKVFNAQVKSPSKGDWASEIQVILKELKIEKTFEEIKDTTKKELSKIVKLCIEKNAFTYLNAIQKQKQKGKDINYTKLELQSYMIPRENFNIKLQRNIFALRTKMNHIQANFCSSNEIKKCDKCNCELDNIHLFKCTRKNKNNINYNHILNGTVLEQRIAMDYIKETQIENNI